MPHVPVGERKKIDLSALKEMSREERIRLLTQSLTEAGARSDKELGASYGRMLATSKHKREASS